VKGKFVKAVILIPLVMGTVSLGTKSVLAIGDLTRQKVPITYPINGVNREIIPSSNQENPQTSPLISARGEVTEDCLLYGICGDKKKDN
jgi:hypothetical protein